jgi:hypothetical protein
VNVDTEIDFLIAERLINTSTRPNIEPI